MGGASLPRVCERAPESSESQEAPVERAAAETLYRGFREAMQRVACRPGPCPQQGFGR